jgi:hypothetical protein
LRFFLVERNWLRSVAAGQKIMQHEADSAHDDFAAQVRARRLGGTLLLCCSGSRVGCKPLEFAGDTPASAECLRVRHTVVAASMQR